MKTHQEIQAASAITEYLVIVDNGYEYSDHSHVVVAVCKDEVSASELKAVLTAWISGLFKADPTGRVDLSYIATWPLRGGMPSEANSRCASIDILPVPVWAVEKQEKHQ